jgi:hypothetical protein
MREKNVILAEIYKVLMCTQKSFSLIESKKSWFPQWLVYSTVRWKDFHIDKPVLNWGCKHQVKKNVYADSTLKAFLATLSQRKNYFLSDGVSAEIIWTHPDKKIL